MLYPLLIFVGLFAVTTVLAVLFYVRAEDISARLLTAEQDLQKLATRSEQPKLPEMVGGRGEHDGSYLGAMVEYHKTAIALLLGRPQEEASAEISTSLAAERVSKAVQTAQAHLPIEKIDPNTGLVPVIDKLDTALTTLKKSMAGIQASKDDLQKRFEDAIAVSQEKEKTLAAEKEQYHQQAMDITRKYEETRKLLEQSSDERANTLLTTLRDKESEVDRLSQDLATKTAELDLASQKMKNALDQLRAIAPTPNRELAAYDPDGRITLVDEPKGIVYINLGTKDRIYKGLTFAVYDKGSAVPKDGKSKAEVEVFALTDTTSTARITVADKRNPIASGDLAANLIWSSDWSMHFVVAGDFDLDMDGTLDPDAVKRIADLVTKWGGTISATLAADTDILLLGQAPTIPPKPSAQDLERDPAAEQKYAAARQAMDSYQAIQNQAKTLMIPIFPYEKFLYLIGYKGRVNQPGTFYW